MPQYNNENSGVLFKNNRATSDKAPTHTGKIEIGKDLVKLLVDAIAAGEPAVLELAAWTKETRDGDKFLSLTVRKPFVKGSGPARPSKGPDPDDSIPF